MKEVTFGHPQTSFFETIDEQNAIVPSARFRMSTGHSHKPLSTHIKRLNRFSSFRLGHIGIHSDIPLGSSLG